MKFNKIYETIIDFIKSNMAGIVIVLLAVFLCVYETPYVIYRPGGAINLSERIIVDNENKISGSYNLSYVTVAKGNLVGVLTSFVMKNWDLVKAEDLAYEDIDYETSLKIDKINYQSSINTATVLAYNKANAKIAITSEKLAVLAVDDKANTDIEFLDKIQAIDGKPFIRFSELSDYIDSLNFGDKVTITVIDKNQKEKERYAYIYDFNGEKVIGVSLYIDYEYETSPSIEIKSKSSEAGSSGGLMLTLAIYDCLTKSDLSHGLNIMGTGTIDVDGKVGPIGGVKYKLLGAQKNNADIFFIPKDNYKEAKKVYDKYKMKFDLIKVDTLDDAISYLNGIN